MVRKLALLMLLASCAAGGEEGEELEKTGFEAASECSHSETSGPRCESDQNLCPEVANGMQGRKDVKDSEASTLWFVDSPSTTARQGLVCLITITQNRNPDRIFRN